MKKIMMWFRELLHTARTPADDQYDLAMKATSDLKMQSRSLRQQLEPFKQQADPFAAIQRATSLDGFYGG